MMSKNKLIPVHRGEVDSWRQFQRLLLISLEVFSKQRLKQLAASSAASPLGFQ